VQQTRCEICIFHLVASPCRLIAKTNAQRYGDLDPQGRGDIPWFVRSVTVFSWCVDREFRSDRVLDLHEFSSILKAKLLINLWVAIKRSPLYLFYPKISHVSLADGVGNVVICEFAWVAAILYYQSQNIVLAINICSA
jgi:hypothetical protein